MFDCLRLYINILNKLRLEFAFLVVLLSQPRGKVECTGT